MQESNTTSNNVNVKSSIEFASLSQPSQLPPFSLLSPSPVASLASLDAMLSKYKQTYVSFFICILLFFFFFFSPLFCSFFLFLYFLSFSSFSLSYYFYPVFELIQLIIPLNFRYDTHLQALKQRVASNPAEERIFFSFILYLLFQFICFIIAHLFHFVLFDFCKIASLKFLL